MMSAKNLTRTAEVYLVLIRVTSGEDRFVLFHMSLMIVILNTAAYPIIKGCAHLCKSIIRLLKGYFRFFFLSFLGFQCHCICCHFYMKVSEVLI